MKYGKDYNTYLKNWFLGIRDEIEFWDKLFATDGECGGNKHIFHYRMDDMCPFQLANDLENRNSKILDVGSGPYSNLGFQLDHKKLDITLLDPLASIYRKLGEVYDHKFPIIPQTGMVECLNLLYPQNSFDIVHMSNSLDHCFDPIEGIRQLLYVTKIGGKVILRHTNNEGENENYKGFHQWNLTVENQRFYIWEKNGHSIYIDQVFKDVATIESAEPTEEKIFDDVWHYNKVIIRKKADIQIGMEIAGKILVQLIEEIASYSLRYREA